MNDSNCGVLVGVCVGVFVLVGVGVLVWVGVFVLVGVVVVVGVGVFVGGKQPHISPKIVSICNTLELELKLLSFLLYSKQALITPPLSEFIVP